MLKLIDQIPLQFYIVSQIITFATSLALAFFVFFKGIRTRRNLTFSLLCLTVVQWSFFYVLFLTSGTCPMAEYYLRACMIGVAFMPAVFTHFIGFLLNVKINRNIIRINYAVSTLTACLVFSDLFAYDFQKYLIFPCWGKAGVLFPIHLLHFFVSISYSQAKMFRVIKHSKGIICKQIVYVMAGTIIGFSAGAVNYLGWFRIPIPPVFNIFISLWVVSIAYAIIRYRLLDIRIVAVRTIIFILVYLPILSVPFFAGVLAREILEKKIGYDWWMVPASMSAIFAIAGLYVYLYLKTKAEKAIKYRKLKMLQVMGDFLEDIKNVRTMNELIRMVLMKVIEIIKVDYASIYLMAQDGDNYILESARTSGTDTSESAFQSRIKKDSDLIRVLVEKGSPVVKEELRFESDLKRIGSAAKAEEDMTAIGASVIIPSFYHETLIAAIVLGEGGTYDVYTAEDMEVFNTLGVNVGLAIKNALFVEDLNKTQTELVQTNIRRRMSQMADGMSHQFNNRFIAIAFPAGLAKDILTRIDQESMSEEDRKKMEQLSTTINRIEDNAIRGGDIARGLLKLTRKDRQKYELMDVSDGFDLAIEMVEYKNPDFVKIKITKNIDTDSPLTYANIAYLQEMYYIILDNAYDAINKKMAGDPHFKGAIDFFVSFDKDRNNTHIVIKDNGEGMPPEILDKVRAFVPYVTTKASSMKSGYGAGVHMLRRFVELHDGNIKYDSIKGEGTTVTIDLPVMGEPEVEDEN